MFRVVINMDFSDGILKEHNIQPYISLMDDIDSYGKGCVIHPTGTGKMYLALKWLSDNNSEPFTFFAPTLTILNKFADLVLEMAYGHECKTFSSLSIEEKLVIIREKLNNPNITFMTYSKLNFLTNEELSGLIIKNVVMDEFHHLGADKWGEASERFLAIHSNCSLMGLSATPIRPSDRKNMTELLFDGRISSIINLEDAIGTILPYPYMVYGIYSFKEELDSLEEKLENKLIGSETKVKVREKIQEARRILEKADGIQEVFKTTFDQFGLKKSKLIVFCSSISDMQTKMKECAQWFPEDVNLRIHSVSSDEDYCENQRKINEFANSLFNGVDLLFSVNMLNEGIHINGLDGVIMLRPTTSNIVFLQQLGRALSVNGSDKRPIIFDLVNNVELMKKDMEEYHTMMNAGSFKRAEEKDTFDFSLHWQMVEIIDYLNSVYRHHTSRKIREDIFRAYCSDSLHPTLENIKLNETFIYEGKRINIGNMLEVVRAQYKLRGASLEDIKKSKLRAMSDEEVEFFESLKIKWTSTFITDLDKKIEIFRQYCQEYGVTMAQIRGLNNYNGYQISTWITQFRAKYKKGTLTQEEKIKLDSIGFAYEADRTHSDEEKIQILQEYCLATGKKLSDIKYSEVYKGNSVGNWLAVFRKKYHAGDDKDKLKRTGKPLTQETIKALEKLGMFWDYTLIPLEEKLRVLREYYEEMGPLESVKRNGVYKGYPLGAWLSDFKTKKKKNQLDSQLENLLDGLGILWDGSKEIPFNVKYQLIKEYMSETGKDFSSIGYEDLYKGYKLGIWVYVYRSKYKARLDVEKGEKPKIFPLTDEEYQKLSLLEGFGVTSPKRLVDKKIKIIEMYCKQESIDLHDFNNIPEDYQGYPIAKWVRELRSERHQGKLLEAEIERLNNLNMVWEIRLQFWSKLAIIDEYCMENNTIISQIPLNVSYAGYPVGRWIGAFKEKLAVKNGKIPGPSRNITPLTNDEYEALTKRDPNWMSRKTLTDSDKMKVLIDYFNEYGSIAKIIQKETYKGYPVGNWIYNYRQKEKEGKCPKEVKEILNKLHMKWRTKR